MASGMSAEFQSGDEDEYFHRGVVLARNGQWKEALVAYKESLRVNPNNAQTYLNLGFVYYELGYDREAQEAFDRASKLQARPCAR
jgi:tetratricopeptide (TPR) repeat protein